MKGDIAAIEHLCEQALVHHRVDFVSEPGVPFEMSDVVDRAGREVVEDANVVPVFEQEIRQV
jgi:hypothetical protein